MYTQCPECLSVFSLSCANLAQARGRVVCGHCQASFDALARLSDRLPDVAGTRLATWPLSNELPIIDTPVAMSTGEAGGYGDAFVETPAAAPALPGENTAKSPAVATAADDDQGASAADGPALRLKPALADVGEGSAKLAAASIASSGNAGPLPLSLRWPERESPAGADADAAEPAAKPTRDDLPRVVAERPSDDAWNDFDAAPPPPAAAPPAPSFAVPARRRWRRGLIAVCILLALLLLGQLAWFKRDTLIANPTTGAWLRHACVALHCRLPLVQDLSQLHLVARDAESHPSVANALLISATVRNDAAFDQPYPALRVTLTDAGGRPLATRQLAPADYLDDAAARKLGIPAGGKVALMLEIEDPGTRAVGFQLDFR